MNRNMIAHLQTWVKNDNEYSIDFDNVWVWLGYSTKGNAKRKLLSVCVKGVDYVSQRGGHNHECIKLSHHGFEQFCLSAPTEHGQRIRDIYIDIKNKHMALRAAIERGDIELRVTSSEPNFSGYLDERHKARAKAINNPSYFIDTNAKVSRAAIGKLPCRLKEELKISNNISARDYMDTVQLSAVQFGESAVKNIAQRAANKDEYTNMVSNMTDRLFDLCRDYDIHGNKHVPRLTMPLKSGAPLLVGA